MEQPLISSVKLHSDFALKTYIENNKITLSPLRIETIDLLRGLVLVLMALDHSRHFFSNIADPFSLSDPHPVAFFTRWITHLCAPVFIFLAGVSAYLYSLKPGRTIQKTSYFLFTRGLWFIIAESTVIYLIWTFYIIPFHVTLAIFGIIGLCMIALSALIFLPTWLIAIISIGLIAGHNMLDSIHADQLGSLAPIWMILHEPGHFNFLGKIDVKVYYPVLPWIGVMGLGYVMGPIFKMDEDKRRKILFNLGLACIVSFTLLRYSNLYGDPHLWMKQHSFLLSLLSFLNVEKYPPSLLYLLVMLGCCFLLLGFIKEAWCGNKISKILLVFGKVPFIFYLLHMPIILSGALIIASLRFGIDLALQIHTKTQLLGYDLLYVYLVWIGVLSIAYWPSKIYGKIKAKSKHPIFSYL